MSVLDFMVQRSEMIIEMIIEHAWLVSFSILIAIVAGVVLGVLSTYSQKTASITIPFTEVMMVVPSLSLMGFFIPILGIGFINAVACLIIYSLLPIVKNTYTGIREIPREILEAASGMGMPEWRILLRIKLPLALPVIIAGIRTAAVMLIGIGAIMSYIGAGGLGELIFRGVERTRNDMIITGAIFVSLLSILADMLLVKLENYLMGRQL